MFVRGKEIAMTSCLELRTNRNSVLLLLRLRLLVSFLTLSFVPAFKPIDNVFLIESHFETLPRLNIGPVRPKPLKLVICLQYLICPNPGTTLEHTQIVLQNDFHARNERSQRRICDRPLPSTAGEAGAIGSWKKRLYVLDGGKGCGRCVRGRKDD